MIFKMAGVFFEVFYALCCIFLIVFIFWYFCDRQKRKGGEDISTSDGLYDKQDSRTDISDENTDSSSSSSGIYSLELTANNAVSVLRESNFLFHDYWDRVCIEIGVDYEVKRGIEQQAKIDRKYDIAMHDGLEYWIRQGRASWDVLITVVEIFEPQTANTMRGVLVRRKSSGSIRPLLNLSAVPDFELERGKHLKKVINTLYMIDDWENLGIQLHFDDYKLRKIRQDNAGKPNLTGQCRMALLSAWLNWEYDFEDYGKPNWKQLLTAVSYLDGGHRIVNSIISNCNGNWT